MRAGHWVPVFHHGEESARFWRSAVPRVPDRWLKSVVHLYKSEPDARAGSPYGGTAFLVAVRGVEIDPSGTHQTLGERDQAEGDAALARSLYVATVNHNLDGGATVLRFNTLPTTSEPFMMQIAPKDWRRWPEHDLAVLPVELDVSQVDFDAIPATRLAYGDEPHRGGLIRPGDDVFMVGRFVERSGRPHNEVQVRFGNVSMVPGDPIETEAGDLVAYLVEMRSRGGFSGSPVFVFRPSYGAVLRGSDGMEWANLLGVDRGHYPTLLQAVDKNGNEIGYIRERSALSVVIPAGRLADLLMTEELVEMRREKQAKRDKQPKVVADSVRRKQEGSLTKRDFEDALGKVARRIEQPKKD